MFKRAIDIVISFCLLIGLSPLLAVLAVLVRWRLGSPVLFVQERPGLHGRLFKLQKFRTMCDLRDPAGRLLPDAERLSPFGCWLRSTSLDELPELWNVLKGDMSLVGPRPNVRAGGVDRYTSEERKLLLVRPGITDLASIVFSDEGEILRDSPDPDALYDAVIRPWKNRLALLYVEHGSFSLDLVLVGLTILSFLSKEAALRAIDSILERWDASDDLRESCTRCSPPPIGVPPGQVA